MIMYTIKVRGIDLLILIFMTMVENLIEHYTGFSYIDEFILILLAIIVAVKIVRTKKIWLTKYEKYMIIFLVLFYAFGNIPNYIYNFQNSYSYGQVSGLFSIKSFASYLLIRLSFNGKRVSSKQLKVFLYTIEASFLILLFVGLVDRIYQIFPVYDYRFGIRTSALFFGHPTELANYAIVGLLMCYFLRHYLGFSKKMLRTDIATSAFLIIIAGRTKGILFLIVFLSYLILMPYMKSIKLRYLALSAPLLIVSSWERIATSLFGTGEARGALYSTSFQIARDYFPLGTGFGTFATDFSRRIYSPVYYQYNINNVWGLSQENSSFIADTTWPAVLGETGIIGLLCYSFFIILLIKHLMYFQVEKYFKITLVTLIIYFIIESFGESIFMSSRGMALFMIIGLLSNILVYEKRIVKEYNYNPTNNHGLPQISY